MVAVALAPTTRRKKKSERIALSDDDCRTRILQFLYKLHKTSGSMKKIQAGIMDIRRAMKNECGMTQYEVTHNLDYLVSHHWVTKVVIERNFAAGKNARMIMSSHQEKYKISDVGIDSLERGSVYKKPSIGSTVNVTNIQGITVVGDGNVVNAKYSELSMAIDELDKAVTGAGEIDAETKLDAAGDISTIRTQIAKVHPNQGIVKSAWESIQKLGKFASITSSVLKAGDAIKKLISSTES